MFILDSLLIAGIRWSLETALTAAEAEMNDDSVLREQLLETEMRREMGEISDEDFQVIEADLLARIRDIKERREGAGPLAFSGQPMETTGDSTFQVEASVSGDFHDPIAAPHTTVVQSGPSGGEEVTVMDIEPGDAAPAAEPAIEPPARRRAPKRAGAARSKRATAPPTPSRKNVTKTAAAASPARSSSARPRTAAAGRRPKRQSAAARTSGAAPRATRSRK